MNRKLTRRGFVKSTLFASATLPMALRGQVTPGTTSVADAGAASAAGPFPSGKLGDQEFSRLMLGGNLIAGWAHSRELSYVSTLMRRYNTESKIRETLELAETSGISVLNSWVMDDNSALFTHWKCGGKIRWIAQARLDGSGGFSQVQRAIDEGAVGVHLTGDTAEGLLDQGKFDKVAESLAFIKARRKVAGVAAHDLRVIVEAEKLKLDVDFYQKTFHARDYFSAPPATENKAVGANDNGWCQDPQAVIDCFADVKKPWIAFKILAAGAIPPRAGFPYAFTSGADFILVGMFDWQIAEDAKLARRVLGIIRGPNSKRTRPWYG